MTAARIVKIYARYDLWNEVAAALCAQHKRTIFTVHAVLFMQNKTRAIAREYRVAPFLILYSRLQTHVLWNRLVRCKSHISR